MRSFKELLEKEGPVMGTWPQITSPDVRLFTVGGDKVLLLDYCTRYLSALTSE